MKKITFLIIIALTWYFAGVYRQIPMMTVAVMELIFVLIMFILPRYFKHKINVNFPYKTITMDKDSETMYSIQVNNKGKLPVNRLKIKMRFGYPNYNKTFIKKNIYGGAEKGDSGILEFRFSAPYCGMVSAYIDNIRLYDYMSVFSAKKRLKSEMKIAVLPYKQALNIELITFGQYEGNRILEQSNLNSDTYNQIKQIREYHNGDSKRFIHWNYSAKTDSLWVKEYESENEFKFDLFLDTFAANKSTLEQWDAFYELLSAIILGILDNHSIVCVHWYDSIKKQTDTINIENIEQYSEMFLNIYNTEIVCPNNDTFDQYKSSDFCFMKLDFDLKWYFNDTLIYSFSRINLNEEINYGVFKI